MKKKIISLMIAVLAAGAFVSCSAWTAAEAMWKYGGTSCRLPDGTYTNSLQAMALWQPANGFRKGGIGAYQMQNDFKNDCYKYFRAAINAMDKLEKGGTETDDQQY